MNAQSYDRIETLAYERLASKTQQRNVAEYTHALSRPRATTYNVMPNGTVEFNRS